jgi:hypothetical protein
MRQIIAEAPPFHRSDAALLRPTDVTIEIDVFDECNTIIDVKGIARRIKDAGVEAAEGDRHPFGAEFSADVERAGVDVAQKPGEAQRLGVILFAGEGEGRGGFVALTVGADEPVSPVRRKNSTISWTTCRTWRPPRARTGLKIMGSNRERDRSFDDDTTSPSVHCAHNRRYGGAPFTERAKATPNNSRFGI